MISKFGASLTFCIVQLPCLFFLNQLALSVRFFHLSKQIPLNPENQIMFVRQWNKEDVRWRIGCPRAGRGERPSYLPALMSSLYTISFSLACSGQVSCHDQSQVSGNVWWESLNFLSHISELAGGFAIFYFKLQLSWSQKWYWVALQQCNSLHNLGNNLEKTKFLKSEMILDI